MSGFQSLFGLLIFFGFVFLLSERKRAVPWKVVGIGLVLQVVGALSLLYIPGMSSIFRFLNDGVVALNAATLEATQFLFGYLAGGAAPFAVENAANNFLVAFQIIFEFNSSNIITTIVFPRFLYYYFFHFFFFYQLIC